MERMDDRVSGEALAPTEASGDAWNEYAVTLDDYHAFTETRPDDEKWELIDGELVLNPSANRRHQMIVQNIIIELGNRRRELTADWIVIPGIGVQRRDDDKNEPVPDVMIMSNEGDDTENWTYDAIVVFEILSKWSRRRDMILKRRFYTSLDPLTHYIVLAQDAMRAHVFARSNGFEEQVLEAADDRIPFDNLGVAMTLGELYRDVPSG